MQTLKSSQLPLSRPQFWLAFVNCATLTYLLAFAVVSGSDALPDEPGVAIGYVLGSGTFTALVVWGLIYVLCLRGAQKSQKRILLASSIVIGCFAAYLHLP